MVAGIIAAGCFSSCRLSPQAGACIIRKCVLCCFLVAGGGVPLRCFRGAPWLLRAAGCREPAGASVRTPCPAPVGKARKGTPYPPRAWSRLKPLLHSSSPMPLLDFSPLICELFRVSFQYPLFADLAKNIFSPVCLAPQEGEFTPSSSFCRGFSSSVITSSSAKFHAPKSPYFEFRTI